MYCRECGKEIADNSLFCDHCGADLSEPVAQAGRPQAYAAPPAGAASPGGPAGAGPYEQPPRKSALPWILGGLGALVVVAVVLVLVFMVFKGGAGETSGCEQAVRDFYAALEKGDVDMLIAAMEPSFRAELEDALGKEYVRYYLEGYFFLYFPQDMRIDIRKMETEIEGDNATVKVTDGTVSYTDRNGEKVSKEASEGMSEPLRLVRVDGKWYLAGDYLKESGLDPEKLKASSDTGDILDGGQETKDGTETEGGD